MIRPRALYRGVLFLLSGSQFLLGAVEDSVYTHPIQPPDILHRFIAVPIPPPPPRGLALVGWSWSVPTDSSTQARVPPPDSAQAEVSVGDAVLTLTLSLEDALDVLRRAGGGISWPANTLRREWGIDAAGAQITFYQEHDGTLTKLPSTAPLDWYVASRGEANFRDMTLKKLSAQLQPVGESRTQRRGTIELLGADIAGQRVSLRVSGNVAINGGLSFKNREKSFTNFRADQNWDFLVDQKQRFDIEGTIGDRISVLVHQDSENDFEWENAMKIAYTGDEDEILQRIDAGNISLSLPGTQFATGGSGMSNGLFGIKALAKLGPVDLTTVASIERSRKSSKSNKLGQEYVITDMLYMKNRYFFLDSTFRQDYYPLTKALPGIPDGIHLANPDRFVTRLDVYRTIRETSETYQGTAYVDPGSITISASFKVAGHFELLTLNQDYTFDPQLGWIRLRSPAGDYDAIAVAYALANGDTIGTVGEQAADSPALRLKLIKGLGQTASHPTWRLGFKNVYSLGGVNINPEGFEVTVIDRKGPTGNDDRFTSGESFLSIFGLDVLNQNGDSEPDEMIDLGNPNVVNLAQGELHFPALLPFAYSAIPGVATSHPAIEELYGYELEDPNQNFRQDPGEDFNENNTWDVPAIYYRQNANDRAAASRFDIAVKQSGLGASEYSLGFNLVEGSETVFINGNPLDRDRDYDIDYFTGTLTILDMSKYGANPEITIDYEENQLVSFDKKVMLGSRAEIDLGQNSFLGLTGLYYNQSIVDERVDVGSEPIQNMLWDLNGRIAREAPFLTRLVDRLPFVETSAASQFRLDGEFAQVLPNPNPLGTAYVDDFEAAKRVTSPSLIYRSWRFSSTPVDKRAGDRRRLAWWNPYVDVNVRDIWPNRETSLRARNLTTTVLVVDALFEEVPEAVAGPVTEALWGGITYPLLAGDYDQTLSKFFEIWVKGTQGRLHVDVGSISEDINGNELIDTEDRPVAGFSEGNGLLDSGEDVGLDGCPDEFEDGMGGCLLVDAQGKSDGDFDQDPVSVAEQIYAGLYDGIYDGPQVPWADEDDPNGDNFFNTRASDPSRERNDNLNGTQGNSQIQEGSYPDTEDLDGLGGPIPETLDNYFTYGIQLDPNHPDFDASLMISATESNGVPTGWRLFRIPLPDFVPEGVKSVSWDNVKHLRLWLDGFTDSGTRGLTGRLQIAKIEFVGNEWEELGLAPSGTEDYVVVDSAATLAVTVANSEDNADYESPPGVQGEFDRLNDIKLREQSLVLDFSRAGIPPGFKGAVKKSVPKQRGTFLVYNTMEMFVFGAANKEAMTREATSVWFWFRLGEGLDQNEKYYEVRKPVYPGWDDRNHISLNMPAISALKLRATPDTTIYVGTDTIPGYLDLDTGMEVYIKGDPSLERIARYTVGIINEHSETIKGQVMLDELRLAKVRKDRGVAVRLSAALNFADLLTTSFNYARRDADFHTVQERIARNALTSETWRADMTFNPHLFLPPSLGVRFPVSLNYTSSIRSPKYRPGKDILAGSIRTAPDSIQSRSNQMTFKSSFAKSTRSKRWLVRQTFDRLQGSVTLARKKESTTLIAANTVTNMSGQLAYPIKFSDENYIQPFKALARLPWLGERLKDTRLYYAPTQLNFTANVTESLTERVTRARQDTVLDTYNFNLARSVKARYRLTDRFSTDYTRTSNSVLNAFRENKLEALRTLDPGVPRIFTEQFSASYNPDLVRWFKPKFAYQARYGWNKNAPLEEDSTGARITTQGRVSGNVTLKLTDIIELVYKPAGKPKTSAGRRGRSRGRSSTAQQATPEKKQREITSPQLKALLKALHAAAGKVLPISFNYTYNRSGGEPAALGQPGYPYRLAFSRESGLPSDTTRTGKFSQATKAENQDISWRSGLNLSRSINLNLSHTRKWSRTRRIGSSIVNRSEDFLLLGDADKVGFPFVNWSLRWSNLEKLPLLNKIRWKVSLDHNHQGSHTRSIQNSRTPVDKYTRQLQPLIGLTINFTNGISANVRASQTLTLQRAETGDSKNTSRQITATASYQHRGGLTIPLPFFRDFNFKNTVNFNLEFDFSRSLAEERKGVAVAYALKDERENWSVKPYITYSFTDKVTGSFNFTYSERFSILTGRQIDRKFGFDMNIAIRGS